MATSRALTDTARCTLLEAINRTLPKGWEAMMMASGRLYYLDHCNGRSQWLPPVECWPLRTNLPYGWESAITDQSKQYYINHLTCITTSCHPYILQTEEPAPTKRLVTLSRDNINGFGFIAGSESPVVVRSVTEGGPSASKLLPGDQILEIAGEDVTHSKRMYIIDKIMGATEAVQMLVTQPNLHRDGVKSSFLSHNKKQRLMARPLRVKFADNISTFSPNTHKVPSSLSYLPNILKVYLENGQTKSFRYDGNTTVKSVLESVSTKLGIESPHHFALVTEDVRLSAGQKFHILSEDLTLRQVSSQPESQYWRCLYRLTFPPKDAYDLLIHDSAAFDYFYQQCRNDVICERFGSELKFDLALRLASLSVQQHFMKINKKSVKVSARMLQKQDGLELFLPRTILESYKGKELRKQICLHLKQNQTFTPPGQKCLSEVQAKLHYLKIIAELPSYSCRTYNTMTSMSPGERTSKAELPITVGPKMGICRVRSQQNEPIVAFDQLERVVLSQQPHMEANKEESICQIEIVTTDKEKHQFMTNDHEGVDFVNFICGLYKVYVDRDKTLLEIDNSKLIQDPNSDIPKYAAEHLVVPASWNYPDPDELPAFEGEIDFDNIIDLTTDPPEYTSQLENRLEELSLSRISSQESNIAGEGTDEEPSDSGSIASLSDTRLSIASGDSRDRRSVISLTDMNFDLQETPEKRPRATDDSQEKMSQLLIILNEESKEMLDGTAKLRMRQSSDDLVDRKMSIESSDRFSVISLEELSLGNLDSPEESTTTPIHLADSHGGSEPGRDRILSSSQDDVRSNDEDDDEIPVSMIDMPSPDHATPTNDSHFRYELGDTSEDYSSPRAVATSQSDGISEIENSINKENFGTDKVTDQRYSGKDGIDHRNTDPVPSSEVRDETLGSIAESFQSPEDQKSLKEQSGLLGVGLQESLEDLVESFMKSSEEALNELVESFRVDDVDTDLKESHVNVCPKVVCDSQEGKKESLQGLVDALIEVSQVVDHKKYAKTVCTESSLAITSDENGNLKSPMQTDKESEGRLSEVVENGRADPSDRGNSLEHRSSAGDSLASQGGHSADDDESIDRAISQVCEKNKEGQDQNEIESKTKGESINVMPSQKDVPSVESDYMVLEQFVERPVVQDSVSLAEKVNECLEGLPLATSEPETSVNHNLLHKNDEIGEPFLDKTKRKANPIVVPMPEERSLALEEENMQKVHSVGNLNEPVSEQLSGHMSNVEEVTQAVSDHTGPLDQNEDEHKQSLQTELAGEIDDSPPVARASHSSTDRQVSPIRDRLLPLSLDEAHGIQLAALLALDVSLEDKDEVPPRSPHIRDEDGSDSGNETIASEGVDGPSGEQSNSLDSLNRDLNPSLGRASFNVVMSERGYSEPSIVIDDATLISMRTVLCTSSLTDPVELAPDVGLCEEVTPDVVEDNYSASDGSQKVQSGKGVSKGLHEEKGDNVDLSIEALVVQPPPGFDDSLSEDLLSVIPPPRLDGLLEGSEPSVTSMATDCTNEDEKKLREEGDKRQDKETTADLSACNVKEKSVATKRYSEESIGYVPTPPPRRRISRKSSAPEPTRKSSYKERNIEKATVMRRETFPSLDADRVTQGNVSSQSPSPSSKQRAIGDSLSKVFSPVMSWSSFKESLGLSSKPRTRTSLKSLWPETTSSCFEDGFTSKSMENLPDIVKGPEAVMDTTEVQLRKGPKTAVRRSESLGSSFEAVISSSIMADEFIDGTVIFPAEFWRKARQSMPSSPGRPAPPRPDCPSLTSAGGRVPGKGALEAEAKPASDDGGSSSDTSSVAPPLPLSEPPNRVIQETSLASSAKGIDREGTLGQPEVTFELSQDLLEQLEGKKYSGMDGVTEAYMDIQMLCHTLEMTQTDLNVGISPERFNRLKERLMLEIREFTGNSKTLVTSLNHSAEKLTLSMNHCMHTLTRLVKQGQQVVWSLHSELIASRLKHKICDLADHFTTMLQLVVEARGKANSSNMVQNVLRQAQTMAVLLSSLMRSVRMMQNYKQVGDKIII